MKPRAEFTAAEQRRGHRTISLDCPLAFYQALAALSERERRSVPQQILYLIETAAPVVEWIEAIPTDDGR